MATFKDLLEEIPVTLRNPGIVSALLFDMQVRCSLVGFEARSRPIDAAAASSLDDAEPHKPFIYPQPPQPPTHATHRRTRGCGRTSPSSTSPPTSTSASASLCPPCMTWRRMDSTHFPRPPCPPCMMWRMDSTTTTGTATPPCMDMGDG